MLKTNERIRILRVVQGKSVREVADAAGVQAARLTAYERGTYQPRAEAGANVAAALHVSSDFLFTGRGRIPAQAWYIPSNTRTEQRTCADIAELLPGLLQELQVSYIVDLDLRGGKAYFMGEDTPLDKLLVTTSTAVMSAIREAVGSKIDFRQEQTDLHVADLMSNLDELSSHLPLRIAIDDIRWAHQLTMVNQQQTVSMKLSALSLAYREAQARQLTPEQFGKICIKISHKASIRESDIVLAIEDILQ